MKQKNKRLMDKILFSSEKVIKLYIRFLSNEITYSMFRNLAVEEHIWEGERNMVREYYDRMEHNDHTDLTSSNSLFQSIIDIDNMVACIVDELSEDEYNYFEHYHKDMFTEYKVFASTTNIELVHRYIIRSQV